MVIMYCHGLMQIQDDTSALCNYCGKIIFNAVPCATREQYFANGGRMRTPYSRLKYFRKWMGYILGYPAFVDNDTMQRIMNNLATPTPQNLKRTLKKLRLQRHYKGISYLLCVITGKEIPEVSPEDMHIAERMFSRYEGDLSYYPDVIYKIFHRINPEHPLLWWIPRRS